MRDCAWATLRAASEAQAAGRLAASAAAGAVGSAYLHPLAKATQVKAILGAATYTALAFELCPNQRLERIADYEIQCFQTAPDVILFC